MPHKWKEDKRAYMKEYMAQRNIKAKEAIFAFYRNKCNWPGCTWNDPRALQVDHVNGNGCLERKHFNDYYSKWLAIQKRPEEYQLLCANHNWIKRCERKEFVQPGTPKNQEQAGANSNESSAELAESRPQRI